MRHLLSVILGFVLSPLIYVIAGYAAVKVGEATGGGDLEALPAVLGLFAALTAGALYAILVMTRLSPFGPILAGFLYLGVTMWALFAHSSFLSTMPASVLGVRDVLHVPAGSGTALLAVPLLSTVLSPRRWRRSATPSAPTYNAAPTYAGSASAAPSYSPPAHDPSSYSPPVYTPSTYQPASSEPPTTERPAGSSNPGT